MEQKFEQIYNQLQEMYEELSDVTSNREEIQVYIDQEKLDIKRALQKIKNGHYGFCENSGQPIPYEWVEQLPTIQTLDDWDQCIQHYGRKSFY
ncbi:RNA polymerase-binding transcription factor DksA [Oikeobacillus pervagus]|uniref:RNA polymerase-binding transcription factor DksA n=1 Tax=Oikeobacillus pervagus TaxID=1325931 RepID=A0AAJ1WJ55_9BACI|nr:hypothetical protein [Oikeobacillus pervagus]MDQ0215053.1 RNA polymerase-binding transcription factor DksA [Oikeobacillus pervagus]